MTRRSSCGGDVPMLWRGWVVGGKIVEFRGQLDMMSLMQQLGAISSPQQAEA